jgi:hypothetical protein
LQLALKQSIEINQGILNALKRKSDSGSAAQPGAKKAKKEGQFIVQSKSIGYVCVDRLKRCQKRY